MATSNTLKTRITRLLPAASTGKNATVKQIVARLNRSTANAPVANATVRGRLSELVSSGVAYRETRSNGTSGFFSSNG